MNASLHSPPLHSIPFHGSNLKHSTVSHSSAHQLISSSAHLTSFLPHSVCISVSLWVFSHFIFISFTVWPLLSLFLFLSFSAFCLFRIRLLLPPVACNAVRRCILCTALRSYIPDRPPALVFLRVVCSCGVSSAAAGD